MAELASLWIGNKLSDIEVASARSFLAQGDNLTIYCYQEVENIPEGVRVKDAAEIFPGDKIIRDKRSGSPAPHADLFRIALMQSTDETWVDLDIIAFRSFEFPCSYVFGYENEKVVNNAVFRLPRDSLTLKDLLQFHIGYRGLPPHLKGLKRIKYKIKSLINGGLEIENWPWGSLGPLGLTFFLKKNEEIFHALPVSAFYSISYNDVERFLSPGGMTKDDIPSDAWGLHLWGKYLRKAIIEKYNGRVPDGCFLSSYLTGTSQNP